MKRLSFLGACLLAGIALGATQVVDADCAVPATLVELELTSVTIDGVDADVASGPREAEYVQPINPAWSPGRIRFDAIIVWVD